MSEADVQRMIADAYRSIVELVEKHDPQKRLRVTGEAGRKLEEMLEELKNLVVSYVIGREELEEALRWIRELEKAVENCRKSLGVRDVLFSKELKSFTRDPRRHLVKKLFIYTHDLARGRISLSEYLRKATAALRTSFRTNLRTAYQSWVVLGLLNELGSMGARMIYPEHGFLFLDRSGKQRAGIIPPNTVLWLGGRGHLSLFIEAPRPVGWEDTGDLSRSWRLYTALRPDMMVYGGMVLNILRPEEDPPIMRPDVIIECKELEDWYLRTRDMRGPLAKPISAEEWRAKWIEGLWAGLADALGVETPDEAREMLESKKSVRVREPKLLLLYSRVYRPKEMILVARKRVPGDVKKYLEEEGITVVDDVGFNQQRLKLLAETLARYSKPGGTITIELEPEQASLLQELVEELERMRGRKVSYSEAIREALESTLFSLREKRRGAGNS